jgi:hypothetical protein
VQRLHLDYPIFGQQMEEGTKRAYPASPISGGFDTRTVHKLLQKVFAPTTSSVTIRECIEEREVVPAKKRAVSTAIDSH